MSQPINLSPDFNSKQYNDHLYDHFQHFLVEAPVFINDEGIVYLTRYKDCLQLLSDPHYVRQRPGSKHPFSNKNSTPSVMDRMLSSWMIYSDPPKHTQLRNIFNPTFLPKNIQQFTPTIESICLELISDIANAPDEIELVSEFSYPLPVLVICDLLGVPSSDRGLFKAWFLDITEATNTGNDDDIKKAEPTGFAICQYFQDLISERQTQPRNDFISELSNKQLTDGTLNRDELVFNLVMLIWGGHETTKNLISNGLLTLMHHPESFELLRQNPQQLELAIEEMLRFESPIQKVSRWSTEASLFGEYEIPENTLIVALIGAANRDPLYFPHSHIFDISRKPNRHIAFGKGMHHCIGNALARVESRVAIATIINPFPNLKLKSYQWRCYSAFRSLEHFNDQFEEVVIYV